MPARDRSTAPVIALLAMAGLLAAGGWWLLGTDPTPPGMDNRETPAVETGRNDTARLESPDLAAPGAAQGSGAAADQRGEIEPEPGDPVRLRVIDAESGKAVPRAFARLGGMRDVVAKPETWRADPKSDRISLPWGGEPMLVQVSAHRYAPVEVRVDGPGPRNVSLARATSLVGRVRDAASAPAVRARVTLEFLGLLEGAPSPDPQPLPTGTASLAITDDEGQFAFTGLAPGHYRARCVVGTASQASDVVRVEPGRWSTVNLWFSVDGSLEVRLLRPDGAPSERSRLLVSKEPTVADEALLARYTDDNGEATLGPLDAGKYFLVVVSDHGTLESTPFEIVEGASSPVQLELTLETKND